MQGEQTAKGRTLGSACERVARGFDAMDCGWEGSVVAFIALFCFRTFIEFFSDGTDLRPIVLLHYLLFYAVTLSGMAIVLSFTLKREILGVVRRLCVAFVLLLIAPSVDLLLSWGRGANMGYATAEALGDLLWQYVTFFGPLTSGEITLGIRFEVAVILVLVAMWSRGSRVSWRRSCLAVAGTYTVIFIAVTTPVWLTMGLSPLIDHVKPRDEVFAQLFALLLAPLVATLYAMAHPRRALALLWDLRPERIIHYALFFLLGIVWLNDGFALTASTVLAVPLLVGTIILAWLFSVITNNLADIEIDRISNPSRPTVRGTIPTRHYRGIAFVALALCLIQAAAVSFLALYLVSVFIGVYYVYSMPPLRLKRIPVASKLLIGVNSLVMILLGQSMTYHELRIESWMALLVVGSVGLAANLIDIKDEAGDRAAGIKTLPVLIGGRRARFLIGVLFVFACAGAAIGLRDMSLVAPSLGVGVLGLLALTRHRYSEMAFFRVYLVGLTALVIYVGAVARPAGRTPRLRFGPGAVSERLREGYQDIGSRGESEHHGSRVVRSPVH